MPKYLWGSFWFCVALKIHAGEPAFWAFQPLKPPALGRMALLPETQSPIDLILAARLSEAHISANPKAERHALARRAWFDLAGLPPSPEEMNAFLNDAAPDAYERLIDELLARPQYGERWGRHWLDIVRFGETNGYERDGNKPHAWRYRDYVIRAFNQDKPYDQFILEQLAGDQLPQFSTDAIIATGFYRLHVWDDEPDNTVQAEFDDLDDIVVTTSGAFLGLTLGCARCHDHKFDPISQKEYYEFLAYLRNVNPYGLQHTGGGGRGTGKITRPLASQDAVAGWEKAQAARVEQTQQSIQAASDEDQRAKKELQTNKTAPPPYDFALAVTEDRDSLTRTHILIRGQSDAPGEEVRSGIPGALRGDTNALPAAGTQTSKGRLTLARWIAHPQNPLTARVMVNRIWQHHFGRGIVASPNDFGRAGEAPTHPELLDYLAQEFIRSGWSVKHMHRIIMISQAYQMSSQANQAAGLREDESNRLFWRQNPTRLEGELIRDSILAWSGQLNLQMAGPGFYPDLPEEIHRTQDSEGKGWGQSPPAQQHRRSVYTFVKRALPSPLLEAFDLSTTTFPLPVRPVTTVAPQALMLLNDDFVHAAAQGLATRLRREAGPELTAQIERAFQIVLQRSPEPQELEQAEAFIQDQMSFRPDDLDGFPALTLFCASLFNLNEAIYVD